MEIVYDNTGLFHFISSLLSLVFGTWVLVTTKGSKRHKLLGDGYGISMLVLLVTSFLLYHLFNKFGIFHWLAVVSSITLLGGFIPVLKKKPATYISMHFNFMYWSVFGLYGAFVAEVMIIIPTYVIDGGRPNAVFYNMVGVAVFITMGLGYYFFYKYKKGWERFDKSMI